MATAPTKPAAKADAPAQRAGMTFGIVPTPTQHEADAFRNQVASNSVPAPLYSHGMDGSAIDPQSYDPTPKTTSWP